MESSLNQTYLNPQEVEKSERSGFLFRQLVRGRRELLFWTLQAFFWGSICAVGMLMTLAFRSGVTGVGWTIAMRATVGFTETSILRGFYRHSLFRQRNGLIKWPIALGACVAVALMELLIMKGLASANITFPGGAETVGTRLLVVRLFILAIWSCLYFAAHLLENAHTMELRVTRAELAARESELRHLQAQMNPHFLFNALNTVLTCKNNPDAVEEVAQSLSEYMQFLLKETRPLEPLSREIDALEKYLTAQAAHLGESLVCRIQCEKAAGAVMVPPMVVQPLLENAFHHRLQASEFPLQIWVTARVEKGFLRITVSSTVEAPATAIIPVNNGLRALEQRLELLLGPQAQVLQEADKGWNRVTIHVPLDGVKMSKEL
jgi:hypothetical protein